MNKCMFCNESTICIEIHTPDFIEQTRKCRNCKVNYDMIGDSITQYIFILNNNLRLACDLYNKKTDLYKYINRYVAHKTIKEFNFIPSDITPDNVQEKIKKYLLFL